MQFKKQKFPRAVGLLNFSPRTSKGATTCETCGGCRTLPGVGHSGVIQEERIKKTPDAHNLDATPQSVMHVSFFTPNSRPNTTIIKE